KPDSRQQMQFRGNRSTIGRSDSNQNVLGAALGIVHKDVEVSIVVEDTGVDEFKLGRTPVSRATAKHEFSIRERRLRVFVQVPHVGMRRSTVQVVVVVFNIFTVVAFVAGESENAFLQNWVAAV